MEADAAPRGWVLFAAFAGIMILVLIATRLEIWDARSATIRINHDRQTRLGLVLTEQINREIQAVD